jgi:hypothetical protein
MKVLADQRTHVVVHKRNLEKRRFDAIHDIFDNGVDVLGRDVFHHVGAIAYITGGGDGL